MLRPRGKGPFPKNELSRQALPEKDWVSIPVPKIVPPSLFERIQEQMEENKRMSARNNKRYNYLLSGLLRCEECGYSIVGMTNVRHGKRSYYRCSSGAYRVKHTHLCTAHHIRTEILDDIVWKQTRRLIEQPELALAEYTNRNNKKKEVQVSLDVLLAKKKKEVRRIEMEKKRLIDLYQAGTITMKEVNYRIIDVDRRSASIQEEYALLENAARQEHQTLQLIEQFKEFQSKLKGNIDQLTFEQKIKIVRTLVKEILVNCSTAKITVQHVVPTQENVYQLSSDSVITCRINSGTRRELFEGGGQAVAHLGRLAKGSNCIDVTSNPNGHN